MKYRVTVVYEKVVEISYGSERDQIFNDITNISQNADGFGYNLRDSEIHQIND